MYLSGKALELTALALGALEPAGTRRPPACRAPMSSACTMRAIWRWPICRIRPACRIWRGGPASMSTSSPPAFASCSVRACMPSCASSAWPSACAAGRGQPDGVRGRLRLRLYRFALHQGLPAALRRAAQQPAARLKPGGCIRQTRRETSAIASETSAIASRPRGLSLELRESFSVIWKEEGGADTFKTGARAGGARAAMAAVAGGGGGTGGGAGDAVACRR